MKLDRNQLGDQNKYALVKNRRVFEIMRAGGGLADEVQKALDILKAAGVLDVGDAVNTEFFVMRLRDEFAGAGLRGYAAAASYVDKEYADEVRELARRAGTDHPNSKLPD